VKSAVKQKVVVVPSVPFRKLLDEYRSNLKAMNRSPRTIFWYLEILERYFAFLKASPLLKPIEQLGTHELISYILHLQNTDRWPNRPNIEKKTGKLSPYSVQGQVRAIKAFWSWLQRESHVDDNPLAKFPLPKVPEKPVNVLTIDQINKLLNLIDRSTHKGLLHYLILLILLDTGIRVSELVHLRIDDMDLQHNRLQVLGKGQKVRSVFISKLTKNHLTHYLNYCRAQQICSAPSPYLFSTPDGEHISVNSIQQFLRRLANRAGLDGIKCSPHIFRHTFATHAVANGANLFALRDIMGHATLQTTMKYTHLQPHDLQIQHAKFSPVANLDIGKTPKR